MSLDYTQQVLERMARVQIEQTVRAMVAARSRSDLAGSMAARGMGWLDALRVTLLSSASHDAVSVAIH